jgi:putative cardiolipin synthase
MKIETCIRFLLPVLFPFLLAACSKLPENYPREMTTVKTDTADTRLASNFKKDFAAHGKQSAFYPLIEGNDALIARISSVRAADKTLDVQYYIWHDDLSGRVLLHELMLAADRGVRVRLLLDDLNQGKLNEILTILDTHPNLEVRMTNPLANRSLRFLDVLRFEQIQRRMHNKGLIADNLVGIVGGRNVGDEYFTASKDMNFSDFDVWCAGPIVSEFSKQFDLYWNHELSIPIAVLNKDLQKTPSDLANSRESLRRDYENAKASPFAFSLRESDLSRKFYHQELGWYWAEGRAIYDSPKKLDDEQANKAKPLQQKLEPLISGATQELIVVSSYFIPGKDGVQDLIANTAKGVKTVVLTNSLASNDVVGAFAGYMDYRKPLVKGGVELYELKPRAQMEGVRKKIVASSGSRTGLHGKLYIKDRKTILIGSMNLDPRSLKYNSEMGVVIESPALAAKVAENLTRQLPLISYHLVVDKDSDDLRWHVTENGQPLVFDHEPEVDLWLRVAVQVLDFVLPEKLL